METITMSENSNTHAYMRLDFLNRACTPGLAIKSIGIKVEGIKKGSESISSKMDELEKEKEAAFSKVAALEKEKQAALTKIDELEKEKEDAARKIAVLEKALSIKEEKFGKYTNAQLRKEEELRTKFEDLKRHTNAECKIEKEAAMSKIAMLEKELETKEVRAYKQAIRALREIQAEDMESKEKMKELTISMQKLTEERNYWETLAKQLKVKESKTAELVEARKEIIRVWVLGHSFGAYIFYSYPLRLF